VREIPRREAFRNERPDVGAPNDSATAKVCEGAASKDEDVDVGRVGAGLA
jgi:hypothetical protein